MLRNSLLLSAFLCTFLCINLVLATTVPHFYSSHDDTGAKIVPGETVTFTSDSVTDSDVQSITWEIDGVPAGTGSPVDLSFATVGTHTVTMKIKVADEDFPLPYSKQFTVVGWSVQLKSVGFKAATGKWHVIYRDIEQTAYSNVPNEPYAENPQWEDNSDPLNGNATDPGDKKYPVGYTSGSQMQVQVIIQGKGTVPEPLYIKGIGQDGFTFGSAGNVQVSWSTAGGIGVGYNVIDCDKDFDTGKVKFWENFDIEWYVKCGAGDFVKIGDSKNDLYVTKNDPRISGAYALDEGKIFQTYIHLACANSDNQTFDSAIVSGIWSGFSSKNVVRRQDGQMLKFLDPWDGSTVDARALLISRNGRSSAWARLFIECLKIHNFHETGNYVFLSPDDDDEKMMFDNWSFTANPVLLVTNYPYSNVLDKDIDDKHEWTYENVTDLTGIAGQNSTDPEPMFDNVNGGYNLTVFNGVYYDVAHGETYNSLTDFEDSLAGYTTLVTQVVAESIIGADLNNDNDTNDMIPADVTGIKQNPTGDQLDHTYTTQ